MEKLKNCYFALQVDEATDLHRNAHLIAYTKFIDSEEVREKILFFELFVTNTTAKNIFDIIDNFLKNNNIAQEKCVGMCTNGTRAMSETYTGLQGLIKKVAP